MKGELYTPGQTAVEVKWCIPRMASKNVSRNVSSCGTHHRKRKKRAPPSDATRRKQTTERGDERFDEAHLFEKLRLALCFMVDVQTLTQAFADVQD